MNQDKLTTPTLQLYMAYRDGRISHNDYVMLLVRRCRVVSTGSFGRAGQRGQRATGNGRGGQAVTDGGSVV